jgi:MoaA/NifB/PqqE/SkfB family radical SAM enzyme
MNKPADGIGRIDKPRYSCLILCHRCFFHCQMCLDWKAPATASSLTFDDCKFFLDSLSEFVDYALDINIMGGEPFMFDWIAPLCDYIHDKGFTPIISTNGYLLDEEMVKKIVDSHLEVLAISLDGLNEATHDSIRGTQGAYSRVMRALEYLRKYRTKKPKIALLTLILERNLGELPKLVEWVKKTGIIDEISFTALQECGLVDAGRKDWFRQPEYKDLWPQDHKKLVGVIDALIALKKEGHQIINPFLQLEAFKEYYHDPEKFLRETTYRIHDYIIDLDPTNEAFLSGHCLGSVKAGPRLKDIWFSEKANQIRREISAHGCDNSRAKVINYLCAFHDGKPIAGVAPASKYEAQLHGQRGLFYQQEGKHELAIAQFKKALELDPHSAQLYVGLASSYSQLKQYYAAVEAYNEAFRLNPDIRDDSVKNAYTGLGLFYQNEGKHELAIAQFKKALEHDPRNEIGRASCRERV